MKKEHEIWGEAQKEIEDEKYIAVLRDIEPTVAKELGEAVGVVRKRLVGGSKNFITRIIRR